MTEQRCTPALNTAPLARRLLALHQRLLAHYGPLHWWPAQSPFEVVVGAVLTQNTAWGNVERAIANLRAAGALDPAALRALSATDLAMLIRPSGTYQVKAQRLRALLAWLGGDWLDRLRAGGLEETRTALLTAHGVGEETADAILLYAARRPTFVVDAYTRRILNRVGIQPPAPTYAGYRRLFMDHLPQNAQLYNEYHAQFVQLAKDHCRQTPRCRECPLSDDCDTGRAAAAESARA